MRARSFYVFPRLFQEETQKTDFSFSYEKYQTYFNQWQGKGKETYYTFKKKEACDFEFD